MRLIEGVISLMCRQWSNRQRHKVGDGWFCRYWRAIRDHKVAAVIHITRADLKELMEKHKVLSNRRRAGRNETARLQPEIVARYQLRGADIDLAICLILMFFILAGGYWTVSYMRWELWKTLFTGALFLIGAFCTEIYIRYLSKNTPQPDFQRRLLLWAFYACLAGLSATALFHLSRVISIAAEQSQMEPAAIEGDETLHLEEQRLKSIEWKSEMSQIFLDLGLILFAVAADIVTGVTAYDVRVKRPAAKETLNAYARLRAIDVALAENAAMIEKAKQRPGILYHQLTVEGLEHEAEAARLEEERQRKEARRVADEAKQKELKAARRSDIGRMMRKALLAFLASVLLLGILIAVVFGAGTELVGIDLTTSAGVRDQFEFRQNVKAAGDVLWQFSGAGTRAVVLGISEQSFGASVILDRTAPTEVGRFNERFDRWLLQTAKEWDADKNSLKPTARGSDIFGFFARAALIFADETKGTKHLIVFSDMRQVGRGYNFERSIGDPISVVNKVEQEGLIPDLTGVEVWILGAHTAGMDERQWRKLKDFWAEYLRRSGAKLKIFSPDRRLPQT